MYTKRLRRLSRVVCADSVRPKDWSYHMILGEEFMVYSGRKHYLKRFGSIDVPISAKLYVGAAGLDELKDAAASWIHYVV